LKYEIQKTCWLIFKEALHNVSKYSKANHCRITVEQSDGILIMVIADDGVGFDLEHHRLGNGLVNMKERAKEIGARLLVNSSSGEGTIISLQLPLNEDNLLPA
jgi:hypothetical protein